MISESTLRGALSIAASEDDRVTQLRATVIAQFEKLTAKQFSRLVGAVQVFSTNGRRTVLYLSRRPVSAVTKVEIRHKGSGTFSDLSTDLYYASGDSVEMLSGYFAENVRVTYTAGYVDDAAPGDLTEALIAQARFVLARINAAMIATTQQVIGKASATLERADYHPLFAACAERYRVNG